ncbi:PKD domain protein [Ancylostoma ceylanicum]|uniref:PKD domain protein n=1 Tax=Ancylostoma ceylanicum TaxID=53326 RepID=A0A0D6L856_9BILA|nr:PKD domain protein [Ancylostoma ceylanicum]
MWPNVDGNACAGINGNTLPPVACNWNGTCNGNTGMSAPGNYPPNASGSSYQPPLNVTAGDQFILCLSNYSYTNQNVNLDFFGTADVTCEPSTPDQTICQGSSATVNVLTFGLTDPTYNWLVTTGVSDPASGENVTVTPSVTTEYVVEITSYEGVFLDTFVITVVPPPTPDAGQDTILCQGQVISLNGTAASSSTVSWTVNTTDTLMEGRYNVQLIVTSPLGCIDSVTMQDFLTVMPKPKANFSWSPNPVLMFNTEVHFQNLSFLDVEYEWSFPGGVPGYSNLERPKVSYPDGETGIYPVTLIVTSELGCKDTLTQPLIVYPEVALYAPNTFTPDGDEYNQTWKVHMDGVDIYSFHLLIFNRWGEMVFESRDMDVPWNGRYNGKPVPSGSYTWTISAKDRLNDSKYEWNGTLNILR